MDRRIKIRRCCLVYINPVNNESCVEICLSENDC